MLVKIKKILDVLVWVLAFIIFGSVATNNGAVAAYTAAVFIVLAVTGEIVEFECEVQRQNKKSDSEN